MHGIINTADHTTLKRAINYVHTGKSGLLDLASVNATIATDIIERIEKHNKLPQNSNNACTCRTPMSSIKNENVGHWYNENSILSSKKYKKKNSICLY